jgi:hypothetical protein
MGLQYLVNVAIVAALGTTLNSTLVQAAPSIARNPQPVKVAACASKPNPCAAKLNPCAAKVNPCAAKAKVNPCSSKPNPCASSADPFAGYADS